MTTDTRVIIDICLKCVEFLFVLSMYVHGNIGIGSHLFLLSLIRMRVNFFSFIFFVRINLLQSLKVEQVNSKLIAQLPFAV